MYFGHQASCMMQKELIQVSPGSATSFAHHLSIITFYLAVAPIAHQEWFSIQNKELFWTLALGALLVTLPWSCVLLILSETMLSVHGVLQGPQAAWCCGTQNPVSNHLSRAMVQDSPFHIMPSSAQCPREPSGHQTCCHLGFQDSCQHPPL